LSFGRQKMRRRMIKKDENWKEKEMRGNKQRN
jgi:hypothetical protein